MQDSTRRPDIGLNLFAESFLRWKIRNIADERDDIDGQRSRRGGELQIEEMHLAGKGFGEDGSRTVVHDGGQRRYTCVDGDEARVDPFVQRHRNVTQIHVERRRSNRPASSGSRHDASGEGDERGG